VDPVYTLQPVLLYPMLYSIEWCVSKVASSLTWVNPQTHSTRPPNFMEIGTPVTGPFFNVTVAVSLYVLDTFFLAGLPVILKSVIVCLCGALPFNITMLNVALNIGDVEFIFLKSHMPETIQAGFPSFPFCRLAIVPNLEPGCSCALTIDATLRDVIIATKAATGDYCK